MAALSAFLMVREAGARPATQWAAVSTTFSPTRLPPHRNPPVSVSNTAAIQGNSPRVVREELRLLVIFGWNLLVRV